jgi:hypothetical protein
LLGLSKPAPLPVQKQTSLETAAELGETSISAGLKINLPAWRYSACIGQKRNCQKCISEKLVMHGDDDTILLAQAFEANYFWS